MTATAGKPTVLVLCSGNSCRSQMAEAFLRSAGGDRYRVLSAGTRPAEDVHPLARRVMEEAGLPLDDHRPTDYRDLLGVEPVHYLITVCAEAEKECPAAWPGILERYRWPLDDPAAFEGTPEEKRACFRRVREEVRGHVAAWLAAQDG